MGWSKWWLLAWLAVVAAPGGVGAFYPSVFVALVAVVDGLAALFAFVCFRGFLVFLVRDAGFCALAAVGDGAGCEVLVFGAAAWVGLAGGVSRR